MGLRDEDTVQHLLRLKSDVPLSEVLQTVRSREAAKKSTNVLKGDAPGLTATANAVSAYKKSKRQARQADHKSADQQKEKPTPHNKTHQNCGKQHVIGQCPAKHSICKKCNKKGHWTEVCKSPQPQHTQPQQKQCNSPKQGSGSVRSMVSNANIRAISTGKVGPPSPVISLQIDYGDKTDCINVIPDTGSDTTIIGIQHLQELDISTCSLEPSVDLGLRNPDDSNFNGSVIGSMFARMTYGTASIEGWVNVMTNLPRPLISWSHAQELRIIPADFPKQLQERQQMNKSQWKARKNHSRCIGSVKQHHSSPSYQVSPPPSPPPKSLEPDALHTYISKTWNDVLRKKEDLKSGDSLKKMSGPPMKIHIKDNAQPYAIHTARRIPVGY